MKLKNINKIFVAGDLHGTMEIDKLSAKNFPDQKKLEGVNILFQVGDFGIIWEGVRDKTEKYWLDWFDKKNFYTLFIGGNHENYDRLKQYPLINFCGGKAAQISNKVFYLQNGYVYEFDDLKIWMFGGATSIDKEYRKEGVGWWRQEIPEYKEMLFGLEQLKENNYKVDYIFTHTLPTYFVRKASHNKMSDKFTVSLHHPCPVGNYLDNVFEVMRKNYVKWYVGHFHCDVELEENVTILYNKIRCIK